MSRDGRMQKALTSILAVMLVASCFVAVASFITPMTAQAAPARPEGCPEECNEVDSCNDCCAYVDGQLWKCCERIVVYDCIDMACQSYQYVVCINEYSSCPDCQPL